MNSKILKIELFGFFLITVVALFGFYYKEVFPDNFISISSASRDVSHISYYAASILGFIEYFSGPWTIIGLVGFLLSYVFVFSKRNSPADSAAAFLLFFSIAFVSFTVYPAILGSGLYFYIKSNFTVVSSSLIGFGLFLLFSYVLLREKFLFGLKHLFVDLPLKVFQREKSEVNPFEEHKNASLKKESVSNKISKKLSNARLSVTELLRKKETGTSLEKTMTPSVVVPSKVTVENNEVEETLTEVQPVKVVKKTVEPKPEKRSFPFNLKNISNVENDGNYYEIVEGMQGVSSGRKTSNPNDSYFREIIQRIEDKLTEFKIDGQIINILKGPVVDTFELELGQGVKVSKVTSSAEDLSLALYGAPIRIVYPMKGRTTVGIEVPRNPREIIYLDEVLSSNEFNKSDQQLPLAMGKDAFGEPFIVNLADMPHMLVAGATGAGKSVFINTILVSLLVKKSPRQMKLILIDPKQLELALYAKLPHLAMPVVTDAKTASISLLWAVQEMERRYSVLKEFGVRNIDGFNEKLKTATPEMLGRIHGFYEDNDADEYELPYIVIIVDEFADLILTKAGKEIENNICRLAAKARAAGIHLIIATQRPSVDVITGLIKSNFPTRVSFRVTTSIDSRTILNSVGAEKLLGKGDMLYKFQVDTVRVHSSYVDENEIEALMDKLSVMDISYDVSAMEFIENGGEIEQDPYAFGSHIAPAKGEGESADSLYDQAVQVVMEHRSASASMLQRRLKVGYNRAANLVEEMERKGVVGPAQGSKPRKVLMSQD